MSKGARKSSPEEASAAQDGHPSFEKALAELEKLVAQMEGDDLSLEQALAAHKRGLELAKFCQQRLEAAQQQVRALEGDVLKKLSAASNADLGDDSA